MHHRSAPRRFFRRARPRLRDRPGLRHGSGRLALSALVSTVLTGLVLGVPVVAGARGGTPFVAMDSFAATGAARTTHQESPVIMGQDGPVTSSTFAGASTTHPERTAAPTDGSAGTPPVTAEGAPTPAGTTVPPPTPAPTAQAAHVPPAPAATPAPTAQAAQAPPVSEAAPPAAPAPSAATTAPADADAEGQVLALANAQRAAAGCAPLTADPALANVARAHSAHMRDRGFFSHTDPDGRDPFDRAAKARLSARAENIAYGQPDPAAVMDAWMSSAGHRANILDCSLTRVGVGMAEGSGGPWWTQLFG